MMKKSVMAMMVITALATTSMGTGFANEIPAGQMDPNAKGVIKTEDKAQDKSQDKEKQKHRLEVMKRLREKAKKLEVDIKGMTIKEAKEVINEAIAERKALKEQEQLLGQTLIQEDAGVQIIEDGQQLPPVEDVLSLEAILPEDATAMVSDLATDVESEQKLLLQQEKELKAQEKLQQKQLKAQEKLQLKPDKQLKQDKQNKQTKTTKSTKQKKQKGSK